MIIKPTTLILGAGASAPFRFPTGYQLLQQVLSLTHPSSLSNQMQNFAPLGHKQNEIIQFYNELLRSGKQSVDSFLEHREEFIEIGKTAIAMALISFENEWELFKHDGNSWYEYLFNELNTQFDDFNENKLSILTFNYDRSLEYFLLTALKNLYGRPTEKCVEMLRSIPIIHLHGDLGGLPDLEKGLVRAYHTSITTNTLGIASQRIKIIHEGIANEPQFTKAKKILSESKVICFLGFGYHELNMERLGFGDSGLLIMDYNHAKVLGSTFGLTDAEASRISKRYKRIFRPGTFDYRKWDVLQFLRETGVLFYN